MVEFPAQGVSTTSMEVMMSLQAKNSHARRRGARSKDK
jgi:hypothetical protein